MGQGTLVFQAKCPAQTCMGPGPLVLNGARLKHAMDPTGSVPCLNPHVPNGPGSNVPGQMGRAKRAGPNGPGQMARDKWAQGGPLCGPSLCVLDNEAYANLARGQSEHGCT